MYFLTWEWAQKARVLHYTRLERIYGDKHSSLFGDVSYEVLWIQPHTNEPNKLECYTTLGLQRISSDKHSSLFGAFVSYEKNEVLWIQPYTNEPNKLECYTTLGL